MRLQFAASQLDPFVERRNRVRFGPPDCVIGTTGPPYIADLPGGG